MDHRETPITIAVRNGSDANKPAWQMPRFAVADVKELTQADPAPADDGLAAGLIS